mmetsp:Transcript_2219/g.4995  ORF Transcript_2219/g.4995 Transcript_2219/m.4995 type:complete len:229 (-) Transcript_2219:630-1316(-)
MTERYDLMHEAETAPLIDKVVQIQVADLVEVISQNAGIGQLECHQDGPYRRRSAPAPRFLLARRHSQRRLDLLLVDVGTPLLDQMAADAHQAHLRGPHQIAKDEVEDAAPPGLLVAVQLPPIVVDCHPLGDAGPSLLVGPRPGVGQVGVVAFEVGGANDGGQSTALGGAGSRGGYGHKEIANLVVREEVGRYIPEEFWRHAWQAMVMGMIVDVLVSCCCARRLSCHGR